MKKNLEETSKKYYSSNYKIIKWTSEYKLFKHVQFWYPSTIFQYSPSWLGGMSLDMYIPELETGIEYQGKQHFDPVDYFGGDEKLRENVRRDARKRVLCKQNNIKVLEWPYSEKITFSAVSNMLGLKKISAVEKLKAATPFPVTDIFYKAPSYATTNAAAKKEAAIKKKQELPPIVIRQYDANGFYVSQYSTIVQAAEATSCSKSSIHKVLAGERRTAGGFYWRREERDLAPTTIDVAEECENQHNAENFGVAKQVLQIDPATGEIIHVHQSIASAANAVGIHSKGIGDVLRGKQKTAGGYFWAFEDEE